MTDSIDNEEMAVSLPNWWVICLVVLLVVAGFVGMGSAQQTQNGTITNASATSTTSFRSPKAVTMPDANDNWQSATRIDVGQTVNGTLPVGDQDWHVFPVESNGSITVRLAAADQTNMSGFLYNSEGDLLDSSYIGPGEQISLTGQAPSGGDYYVFVRNEANTTLGAYAFEVSVGESEASASEETPLQTETNASGGGGFSFNLDLLAGAAVVVAGGYLIVHGVTDSSQDEDQAEGDGNGDGDEK